MKTVLCVNAKLAEPVMVAYPIGAMGRDVWQMFQVPRPVGARLANADAYKLVCLRPEDFKVDGENTADILAGAAAAKATAESKPGMEMVDPAKSSLFAKHFPPAKAETQPDNGKIAPPAPKQPDPVKPKVDLPADGKARDRILEGMKVTQLLNLMDQIGIKPRRGTNKQGLVNQIMAAKW